MADSNASPNPEDNKDPVDSTGSTLLVWLKLFLGLLVAAVGTVAGSLSRETVAVVADASTIADFPGVKAATFALCATTMLSLTMLPTGDRPGERDLDLVVKLASLAFAFLSGWFWLESALGDFSLRYYLLTIGILVLVVFSAVIFWPATYLAFTSVRNVLKRIRR